jgi:uncharacterized protein YcgI (DUF1989 family)
MASYGKMRVDHKLEPATGKAFPVYKGEVYRIVQEEQGGQCVDCLIYNLHDYREHMSTSIMRRQGFVLEKGAYIISASPRNRLMMKLLDKQDTNVVNVIVHRCSAAFFEAGWGMTEHTNCQDMLAEAIGEYGLTPDDTHAVLCPWTPATWDNKGTFYLKRNIGVKKGDYIDFLALMDVLIATNICGTNDFTTLGNYFQRPVRLQIFEQSEETSRSVEDVSRRFPPLKTQRTPKDFRVRRGEDVDYELKQVPGYKPQFINYPITVQTLEIELPEEDYEQVKKQVAAGLRDDDEDAVRTAVIEWYCANRTSRHPILNYFGF